MKLSPRLLPILALAAALNAGSAAAADTGLPARGATPEGRATTFEQVTAQLESGGDVYAYVSAQRWLSGLATNLAAL